MLRRKIIQLNDVMDNGHAIPSIYLPGFDNQIARLISRASKEVVDLISFLLHLFDNPTYQ